MVYFVGKMRNCFNIEFVHYACLCMYVHTLRNKIMTAPPYSCYKQHFYIVWQIAKTLYCCTHCKQYCTHKQNETRPHGLRMRGLNFLIHYNKVEVYALIFGHILFNSTLGRKTALSQHIL